MRDKEIAEILLDMAVKLESGEMTITDANYKINYETHFESKVSTFPPIKHTYLVEFISLEMKPNMKVFGIKESKKLERSDGRKEFTGADC